LREVVGVALVHAGRVLAARRSSPEELAGHWEFPGGKVEPDEDPAAAAVREMAEELGCTVAVTGWLEGSSPLPGLVLRVATARLVDGDPVPSEHDAITWVAADRPFLRQLRELLGAS
jgi:8-oxo-dGTP diphosphatase